MTQASISVNAVAGSNTDLTINTLVQLNNIGNGGESTYAWSIIEQPPGTTDSLSSLTLQNPTFTPKKEGTYLVEVIVNEGLADEQTNRVVCAIRQLKTRIRVPGAGETTEADATDGYATDANAALRLIDTMRADPGMLVAKLGYSATVHDVVYFEGTATLKTGLPGEEYVPIVLRASSTGPLPAGDVDTAEMGMVLAAVDGGALTSGKLVYVRTFGFVKSVAITGSTALGPIYLGAAGSVRCGSGTRYVGRWITIVSANLGDIFFNGSY